MILKEVCFKFLYSILFFKHIECAVLYNPQVLGVSPQQGSCPPGQVLTPFQERVCPTIFSCKTITSTRCSLASPSHQIPGAQYSQMQPQTGYPAMQSPYGQPQAQYVQPQYQLPQQYQQFQQPRQYQQQYQQVQLNQMSQKYGQGYNPGQAPYNPNTVVYNHLPPQYNPYNMQQPQYPAQPEPQGRSVEPEHSGPIFHSSDSEIETTTATYSMNVTTLAPVQPAVTGAPAFVYQPVLPTPSPVKMEATNSTFQSKASETDNVNGTCKTIYEKVCKEGQTPQCQVIPRSVCGSENYNGTVNTIATEPHNPGCNVQYLMACNDNNSPRCSVIPQRVCLNGTKTKDSEALVQALAKNSTSPGAPVKQEVNIKSTTYAPVTESKTLPENPTTYKTDKETTTEAEKEQEEDPDDMKECPKKSDGYTCTESSEKICKKINNPMCGPQVFEKCTYVPVNETSQVCNTVLNKICTLRKGPPTGPSASYRTTRKPSDYKPDKPLEEYSPQLLQPKRGLGKTPVKPTVHVYDDIESSDSMMLEEARDKRSTNDENDDGSGDLTEIDEPKDASSTTSKKQRRSLQDDDSTQKKAEGDGFEVIADTSDVINTMARKRTSLNDRDEAGEDKGDEDGDEKDRKRRGILEEPIGDDSVKEVRAKRDAYATAAPQRKISSCVQKQITVCSTNYTMVSKPGYKVSCVNVPTFSCEEIKIGGVFGNTAENCTQYRRQVCNRFPTMEPVAQPSVQCQNMTVSECHEEIYSGYDLVKRTPIPAEYVVKCEEVESKACGLLLSVELVVDECYDEERSSCQSGYTEKCGYLKKRKCKSNTSEKSYECAVN